MDNTTKTAAQMRSLDQLTLAAGQLGHDIVSIAGFLDTLEESARHQVEALGQVTRHKQGLATTNASVAASAGRVRENAATMRERVEASLEFMRSTATRTERIATWVQSLEDKMQDISRTLETVEQRTEEIASISTQVNMLAINAKIESARAGTAGLGFSVVAEAINGLSQQTAQAASGIDASLGQLVQAVSGLTEEAHEIGADAGRTLEDVRQTDTMMGQVADSVRSTHEGSEEIALRTADAQQALDTFDPAFAQVTGAIERTGSQVHEARERTHALIDRSESILQGAVLSGGGAADQFLIDAVQKDAAQIGALLEEAVDRGEITMEALFSSEYTPVPGSNPQQVMAPFTKLTDRLFPPIQERALQLDPRIVFCAAVDRRGYLPTHNRKFSARPSADPDWNAANCRNRRIFDDRVGLKSGRSSAPFLLQVYRRDMGGGVFKMMNDLSAPILVKGRHWGGLRLAFTTEAAKKTAARPDGTAAAVADTRLRRAG